MKKLEQVRTRQDIIDLQKNDTIKIEITKKQARLIGFAIDTEVSGYEELIKTIQDKIKEKEDISDKKELNDMAKSMLDTTLELMKIRDNLKKYYGWLQD